MALIADSGGVLNTSTPITGFTAGSIIYVDSSTTLQEDNANLFWDATNDL